MGFTIYTLNLIPHCKQTNDGQKAVLNKHIAAFQYTTACTMHDVDIILTLAYLKKVYGRRSSAAQAIAYWFLNKYLSFMV